ncbi:MAG: tRNA pseudouridine(55) synthase TruB [Nocardioidaceae bacterium]
MSEQTSGLVIVDKPAGFTSHDVVARVRRLAGTRKVGHAGTLDPMATGVLVLGVNRATRLLGHLMLTEKAYDATIKLGESTSTDDAEGETIATSDTSGLSEDQVRAALAEFVGDIDQVPTAVSAIKVDGKRAYARVRAGEEVELSARRVHIASIEVTRVELPEVDISVRCSSGTYIRAIARDLGAALGVGGHLSALRRTAVGAFAIAQARSLDVLTEDFAIMPIAEAARRSFPVVELDETQAQDVRFGRRVTLDLDSLSAVFAPDGEFLALYEPKSDGWAKAAAVFV